MAGNSPNRRGAPEDVDSYAKFRARTATNASADEVDFRLFNRMYTYFTSAPQNIANLTDYTLEALLRAVEAHGNPVTSAQLHNDQTLIVRLYNPAGLTRLAEARQAATRQYDELFKEDVITDATMNTIKTSIAKHVLLTTFVMGLYERATSLHNEFNIHHMYQRMRTNQQQQEQQFSQEKQHLKDLLTWLTGALSNMYSASDNMIGEVKGFLAANATMHRDRNQAQAPQPPQPPPRGP